jgi:hypothetical protein
MRSVITFAFRKILIKVFEYKGEVGRACGTHGKWIVYKALLGMPKKQTTRNIYIYGRMLLKRSIEK